MMNIILLAKQMQRPVKIHLSRPRAVALLIAVLVLPLALASYLGFYWGAQYARSETSTTSADSGAATSMQASSEKNAPHEVQEALNALTARLGALQAQVIRINALGKRLVDKAGLEKGEFDFGAPPPQGGPEEQPSALLEEQSIPLPSLIHYADSLNRQLEDRQQQLNALEMVFMNRNLLDKVLPGGRPVNDGWLSSYFGYRADPFTGRREFHQGVDIAGSLGEPVMAVAAGIVSYAGKRSGYGNLVEINHGNGFITRYGHNATVLVAEGDTVSKGQVVALMGSTGHSTGPHVHFEVWRGGRVVDPLKYLSAAN